MKSVRHRGRLVYLAAEFLSTWSVLDREVGWFIWLQNSSPCQVCQTQRSADLTVCCALFSCIEAMFLSYNRVWAGHGNMGRSLNLKWKTGKVLWFLNLDKVIEKFWIFKIKVFIPHVCVCVCVIFTEQSDSYSMLTLLACPQVTSLVRFYPTSMKLHCSWRMDSWYSRSLIETYFVLEKPRRSCEILPQT